MKHENYIRRYWQLITAALVRDKPAEATVKHHVQELTLEKPECMAPYNEIVYVTPAEHFILHCIILAAQQRRDPSSAWVGWSLTLQQLHANGILVPETGVDPHDYPPTPPPWKRENFEHAFATATAQFGLLRPVWDYDIIDPQIKSRVGKRLGDLWRETGKPLCLRPYDPNPKRVYPVADLERVILELTGKPARLQVEAPAEPVAIC